MLLNIVTDEELYTSEIVKSILMLVLLSGIGYHLFRLFSRISVFMKSLTLLVLVTLIFVFYWVISEFLLEYSLLNNPKYIRGITTGYCEITGRGEGIEFEYELNGIRFQCCNTFHPLPKKSIVVPGGTYMVRYSDEYADAGRMNFRRIEN